MLDDVLPDLIANSLDYLEKKYLQELRIRTDKPMSVCYDSKYFYLGKRGITNNKEQALIVDSKIIENIVLRASKFSIYAVNENIINGYITIDNGIRIGMVGQVVREDEKITTIKNISSLNIRFPHQIKNIAKKIIPYIFYDGEYLNTLIVSAPGAGKTTLLRDTIRLLSDEYGKNILIIDERNEISSYSNGINQYEIGDFCDVYTDCCKKMGILNGVRSMNPNIIAVDELGKEEDYDAINYASTCGVKLLATVHCGSINELKHKKNFSLLLKNKIFDRYVFLDSKKAKGTIKAIYDNELNEIVGENK